MVDDDPEEDRGALEQDDVTDESRDREMVAMTWNEEGGKPSDAIETILDYGKVRTHSDLNPQTLQVTVAILLYKGICLHNLNFICYCNIFA